MGARPTYAELEQRVTDLTAQLAHARQEGADLKQAAQLYHLLADNVQNVIWTMDMDLRLTYISPSIETLRGYSPEEIGRLPLSASLSPASHTQVMEVLARELERERTGQQDDPLEVTVLELEQYCRDGSTAWTETRTRFLRDEQGRAVGILGVASDITDRRRAEEERKEREERFQTLLDSIEEGYFESDLQGNITFFNDCLCRIIGYPPEELLGLNNRDYTSPTTARRIYQIFKDMYFSGKPTTFMDYEVFHRDGGVRVLEVSATLLNDRSGTPVGFRGVARDVTDRRRAEKALRQSEERYRSLIENAVWGVFICERATGRLLYVNACFREMFGLNGQPAETLSVRDLIPPEEFERLRPQVAGSGAKALPPGGSASCRAQRLDGTPLSIDFNATAVVYQETPALQGVVRDITVTQRLEQQLRQAQKLEAIGTLAGGTAHDFNNLLMGIQGHVSLLLAASNPGDEHFRRLQSIEQYVQLGANLTRQLLGFARAGKYEARPSDMNLILRRSAEMFGRTHKEIEIRLEPEDGLWTVEVDRGQIEQVLLNMYVNAWQAMPSGGELRLATANLTLTEETAPPYSALPGDYVAVTVSDTGIGMDSQTRQKIFDPFFTTKERGRGSGLGLASAYGIIKNHGGLIHVTSVKGQGSSFTILLPASHKSLSPEKPVREKVFPGSETILLVDDEEMIRDVGRDMLEALGFTVLTAAGGEQAVELYRSMGGTINLVILDMIMPRMSGGEAFDRLKECDPKIKVLLCSGYSLDSQASDILNRGCSGFIQKPFSLEALSHKLREVLEQP